MFRQAQDLRSRGVRAEQRDGTSGYSEANLLCAGESNNYLGHPHLTLTSPRNSLGTNIDWQDDLMSSHLLQAYPAARTKWIRNDQELPAHRVNQILREGKHILEISKPRKVTFLTRFLGQVKWWISVWRWDLHMRGRQLRRRDIRGSDYWGKRKHARGFWRVPWGSPRDDQRHTRDEWSCWFWSSHVFTEFNSSCS